MGSAFATGFTEAAAAGAGLGMATASGGAAALAEVGTSTAIAAMGSAAVGEGAVTLERSEAAASASAPAAQTAAAEEAAAGSATAATRAAKSEPKSGASPCHSFLPSTKVLMADGDTKAIKNVKAGDKVKATDPQTGKSQTRTVEKLITTKDDEDFATVTIRDGKKTEKITATVTHPFWVTTTHTWTDAGNLKPHTRLRTAAGATVTIQAVSIWHHRHLTHDLTVSTTHTYYVLAGAAPVLVHNCNTTITARQVSLIREGPQAKTSVPATGAEVTSNQSEAMQGLSCHSCGEAPEGVTMVGDHQPPTGLNPDASQNLFPQCPGCSADQSKAVLRAQKMMRDHFNMPDPREPGYYSRLMSILDSHTSG